MKNYLKRLKNPATIVAICGYLLTIFSSLGLSVNSDVIMSIVNSICAICVLLGILNNPETDGIDLPK